MKEDIRDRWYKQKYTLYELVKTMVNHEVAFLPTGVRALTVYKVEGLLKVFDLINFFKKPTNIYRSVAYVKDLPKFTYNPKRRSSETGAWFQNDFHKHITGYSVFMDFDVNHPKEDEYYNRWDKLLEETNEFISFLEQFKVPYYIYFSGMRGFGLVIDYAYLPHDLGFNPKDKKSIYGWTKRFVERCKEVFGLNYLDLRNNSVPDRLMKAIYSLSEDNNVVLPLSNEQLANFRLEDMKAEKVMKNVHIFKRGLLERQSNLSLEQKRENIQNFINEFKLV